MESRDPFEDKVRSYQHDGRNTYGENDKSSRKAIRFRKAWVNRSYRRAVNRTLDPELSPDDVEDNASLVKRKAWRKHADKPLGNVVQRKAQRRGGAGQIEPSAAQREAQRRGRDGRRGI